MKKIYCWMACLMGLLSACETEIEFKQKITDPMLVMNCLTSSDSPLEVHLSQSRFFLDDVDTFPKINDARVSLYVNDCFVENLQANGEGCYGSLYMPSAGDKMRLQTEKEGFPMIYAENTIPRPIPTLSVDTTIELMGIDTFYGWWLDDDTSEILITKQVQYTLNIAYQDPVGEDNFYSISIYWPADFYRGSIESIEVLSGDVSNYYELDFSDNRLFSDYLLDGKTINVRVVLSQSQSKVYNYSDFQLIREDPEGMAYISLRSLSPSYYSYLKTINLSSQTEDLDFLFAEPVQVYSNVENGMGLFGSFSEKIDSLPLLNP